MRPRPIDAVWQMRAGGFFWIRRGKQRVSFHPDDRAGVDGEAGLSGQRVRWDLPQEGASSTTFPLEAL